MKIKQYTTIKVSKETHDRLDALRLKNQTYDNVITELLDGYCHWLDDGTPDIPMLRGLKK